MASVLSQPHFHNEAAAYARLEAIVWPEGPHCPRCGALDRITNVKGGRMGLRRCGHCKREFTVKVGTVFESSHVPLHLWFQAAHLMSASKKGISAHELHRILGVTYKSAWFMGHRLREAMRLMLEDQGALGGNGKAVEVDETYVGGKESNKHADDLAELAEHDSPAGYKNFWVNGYTEKVRFDDAYHANALRLVVERRKREHPGVRWREGTSFGSIVGELKKLDDFEHDREFVIVPPVGDPVICTFPDSMLGEMGQYWSKIVRVSGALAYKASSPFPKSVEVREGGVELYREPPKRTLAQMRGVFEGHERRPPDWGSLLHG